MRFKPNQTDYSTLNSLNVDINSIKTAFNSKDIERIIYDEHKEDEQFQFQHPILLIFKFIEDPDNWYYIEGNIDTIKSDLKYNFIKQDESIINGKFPYDDNFYISITKNHLTDEFVHGLECYNWDEQALTIRKGSIFATTPFDDETIIKCFETKEVIESSIDYNRMLNKFNILFDEADEHLKPNSLLNNSREKQSYDKIVLGRNEEDNDSEDIEDNIEPNKELSIQEDQSISKTNPIFTELKKVIWCNDISINEEKLYCLSFIYTDDHIDFFYMNNELTSDLYYRCKYHNIPFEYSNDESFFNNVIDVNFETEREINLSYYKEKIDNMISTEDFSKIDELKIEGNNLLIDELKDKDPILLMMKSAEEYKEAVDQYRKKYKEIIESNEVIELPTEYSSAEEFKEKDPEGYKAYNDKLEEHTKKEQAELELAQMKYQTSQAINKQFLLESQMSISFDATKRKTEKYLENATKNQNEAGIKLYSWILDRYQESVSLKPLFSYFEQSNKKYEIGKFSHTLYMNYDKVVKRVRKRLRDETDYRFIDPIIIISRVKQIIEKYPDKFNEFDPISYSFMVYYTFIKMIDSEKKEYLKQNGLFIIRFIQHLALFFNDYYLFSERDQLVDNIAILMNYIKKDIEDPNGIKKYKDSYNTKTIPFILEKEKELQEFLDKEKERIRQERMMKKLTLLSLAEQGNNPITDEEEETE